MGTPPTPLIPQVFVICGVGALAGFAYSWYHAHAHAPLVIAPAAPSPVHTPVPANTTSVPGSEAAGNGASQASPAPAALGLEISVPQAKALFDAGAPFLDSRLRDEYDQGHVAGAFHLTADQLTGGKTPEVLNFLDPSKPVVIYCGGGACDASHNVAALLQQLGFAQCHIMKDGYPGWRDAGHPTTTDNPLGSAWPLPSQSGGANG